MEDVSWHMKNEYLFGSAGDDGRLVIWDTRTNKMQHHVKVHEKEVETISKAKLACLVFMVTGTHISDTYVVYTRSLRLLTM